jgi:hypothetical protein
MLKESTWQAEVFLSPQDSATKFSTAAQRRKLWPYVRLREEHMAVCWTS